MDAHLRESLELCQRRQTILGLELCEVEAELRQRALRIEAIGRVRTIPGVGPLTATMIYAWVGDVGRFPNAKTLGGYAALVPKVRQRAEEGHSGSITGISSKALHATLVKAAHVWPVSAVRRPLHPDMIDRIMRKHVRRIGVKLGPSAHSMRATFITRTLENGASLDQVQHAAGHVDASTTKFYDRRGLNPGKSASFFVSY